ncbi:MAG: O-succinylhomoserine sulfhydrylase [Acidiferrobacteraceae bacterium]|jgi:O-succinylhomoserine sulfhydrylase|nr:O-succinylhomoserine sulfhydrylase [Acidiferrobacteraceae bacterium]MDP6434482.1 O-succinylhomoserine sulfhydrylase [Arenicellales bacterium]MDP6671886.1 O-succinylhomoserine sulfhydrylase [Arenicellales bacterium]|tara:strand:+ start:9293 stop:10510 length:1218 start_codon:yes stop_codon:yes gene_type:complete
MTGSNKLENGQQTSQFGLETQAIRAGHQRTGEGEHGEPIFTTSSFVFENAKEAAARFSGDQPGNVYSRFTNPTVRAFEQRLCAMESGDYAVATASGMAALLTTGLALLKSGDHVVLSRSLFGSTISLFTGIFSRLGVKSSFVELNDIDSWAESITSHTRLLILETPSNPLLELADISQLAELAHSKGVLLVVDNVLCTPVLQRPLELGADIVIHSATKYLDGQGRCIGGAVVTRCEEHYKDLFNALRTGGAAMSPFNAWVFLKGLETLTLRMRAHCKNAFDIATWLETRPEVSRVYYPGLASHPNHQLAVRQQNDLFGGMVSFEVAGGREGAWRVIDNTQLLSITANLGDTRSTITHPATTTHARLSEDERAAAGITEGLIRVSVGHEDVDDLCTDLLRGLSTPS